MGELHSVLMRSQEIMLGPGRVLMRSQEIMLGPGCKRKKCRARREFVTNTIKCFIHLGRQNVSHFSFMLRCNLRLHKWAPLVFNRFRVVWILFYSHISSLMNPESAYV